MLKFKIVDVIRKRGREVHIEPLDEQSKDDAMDGLFARDSHVARRPRQLLPQWRAKLVHRAQRDSRPGQAHCAEPASNVSYVRLTDENRLSLEDSGPYGTLKWPARRDSNPRHPT